MMILDKSKKMFIDFDGVVLDSNYFKEKAIRLSIFKIGSINLFKVFNYVNFLSETTNVRKGIMIRTERLKSSI